MPTASFALRLRAVARRYARGDRNPILLAVLCVVVAVALAHGGALSAGFVSLDDPIYVVENPYVRGGLSARSIEWAFRPGTETYFQPLSWLSLMLDVELFGVSPAALHAGNVVLHAIGAVLLLLVLARTTRRLGASLAATLLFAVHPLTVEAVTWVTERKTVLATAFGLAALLAWVRHLERPSRGRAALAVGLYAASLLAKPSLVIFPALLLVLDFWPLGRIRVPFARPSTLALRAYARGERERGWGALLLEKMPFVVVAAASLALVLASTAQITTTDRTLGVRVANAIVSIPRYLSAAFWPARLTVFHPFPVSVPAGDVVIGLAVIAAVTAGAIAAARRAPAVLAGWAWFLVALAPVLGLHRAGLWPAWADRFAYVPLMGLAIAVAFGVADAIRGIAAARVPAAVAAACAVVALGVGTREQVRHWTSSATLFGHGVEMEPDNAVLRYGLGTAYAVEGRFADAERELAEAVRLAPPYARAWGQLGAVKGILGREAQAEVALREAVRLDPRDLDAVWSLAELLAFTGRMDEARPLYARYAQLAPPALAARRARAAQLAAP
jgi:protein O-mannosyl-transferase